MRKWLNFYSYILWFICSHVFVAKISCLDLLWCLFPVLLPTLFCTLCVAYDLLQRRWWETSWEVLTWLLMTMNSNRGNWRERGRENLDVRDEHQQGDKSWWWRRHDLQIQKKEGMNSPFIPSLLSFWSISWSSSFQSHLDFVGGEWERIRGTSHLQTRIFTKTGVEMSCEETCLFVMNYYADHCTQTLR